MNDMAYQRHLGVVITDVAEGYARAIMPVARFQGNRFGVVHGGAICSLVDTAASMAVRSTVFPGQRTATIGLTVSFLASVKGKELIAEGCLVRRGSTIGFVDVDVKDDKGTHVARGVGTFMVFREGEGHQEK